MTRWILLLCLLVPAADAWPAEPPPELSFYAVAQVQVDADGHATVGDVALRKINPESLVATVASQALKKRIASWAFDPARRGGTPVSSETSVLVRMQARGDDKGNLGMFVIDAKTGARAVSMDPPHYPNAMGQPAGEGVVVLQVGYNAEGLVNDVAVEKSEATTPAARHRFRDAAVEAAQHWRFAPERAAGAGIPGRIRIPVAFCLGGGCAYNAGRQTPEEQLVTLDPSVDLRTAVAGTAL